MPSANKFWKKKADRCLELSINRQTVVDQVAAYLYAASIINDKDDIKAIVFDFDNNKDLVPIKVYFTNTGGVPKTTDG